jgi:DNA-binding response OmpR family regulator
VEILVACAEPAACGRLVDALRDGGHSLRVEATLELALLTRRPDAVVVCDGTGFGAVRRRYPEQTLLAWLPAPSTERTADLLDEGADEVLHAGMGSREVAARIAMLNGGRHRALVVEVGQLRIDDTHGEATWRGRPLALTPREREVLRELASAAGRPIRRETLYRQVWGYAMPRGDRTVDVNVKRLRDKLAAEANEELAIVTQPGVGYRLDVVTDL